MGFYNYFTINAYNLYGLLGLNWRSLEEFPAWVSPTLTAASALLAVVLSGIIYWKSKHEHAIFAVPVVIISTIYLFAPKMHERYLFPALFFPCWPVPSLPGICGCISHFSASPLSTSSMWPMCSI